MTEHRYMIRQRAPAVVGLSAARLQAVRPAARGASRWLNAGLPPTEVARRLGHAVAVLLRVYANCIDGGDDTMNDKIGDALG